jgi:hypothetical protein
VTFTSNPQTIDPTTESIDLLIEESSIKVVITLSISVIKRFFKRKVFIISGKCLKDINKLK